MQDPREFFRALELAHYAERFRDKIFVIALPATKPFSQLLGDLKVLAGYHIQTVLVLIDGLEEGMSLISSSNKRGGRFHLTWMDDAGQNLEVIKKDLSQGCTPVISCAGGEKEGLESAYQVAADLALNLEAKKLFLIHDRSEELRDALPRTHLQASELENLVKNPPVPDLAGVLELIARYLEAGIPDIVLISAEPMGLFREVFTHDGAGMLFNRSARSQIRPGRMDDVTDISLLLRPEHDSGNLRLVNENQIEAHIDQHFVYEIEGLLVGSVRLKPYGDWAELSQFVTLPRYRGKGRARELALHAEAEAKSRNTQVMFALSIDSRMWEFFKLLGYKECPRDELPPAWAAKYDFSRPSKAFKKEISA